MNRQQQTLETSAERKEKILLYILDEGPALRSQLCHHLGITTIDLASLIFELKSKKGLLYVKDEHDQLNDEDYQRFWLTKSGRETALLLRAKTPKVKNGQRHVHGVVGKFDLSKPFNGTKALVYEAVTSERMEAGKIAEVANLNINLVTQSLDDMVRLQVLNVETAYGKKQFSRVKMYEQALLGNIDDQEEAEERCYTTGTIVTGDAAIIKESGLRKKSGPALVFPFVDNVPRSAAAIVRRSGIETSNPHSVLLALFKKGLVERAHDKNVGTYMALYIRASKYSKVGEIPAAQAPVKPPVPLPLVKTQPPIAMVKGNGSGKTAIEQFLADLSEAELFDVLLEVTARIEIKHRELRSFHDNIMKSAQKAETKPVPTEH